MVVKHDKEIREIEFFFRDDRRGLLQQMAEDGVRVSLNFKLFFF